MDQVISTRNVDRLTTFELRQELVRRGALDIEDSKVNHRSLLQRLVVELVKDERVNDARVIHEQVTKVMSDKDDAKRAREQKKQEALERSLARQADPAYFSKIAESNVKVVQASADESVADDEEPAVADDPHDPDFDPFKPKSNGKFKIFVR